MKKIYKCFVYTNAFHCIQRTQLKWLRRIYLRRVEQQPWVYHWTDNLRGTWNKRKLNTNDTVLPKYKISWNSSFRSEHIYGWVFHISTVHILLFRSTCLEFCECFLLSVDCSNYADKTSKKDQSSYLHWRAFLRHFKKVTCMLSQVLYISFLTSAWRMAIPC